MENKVGNPVGTVDGAVAPVAAVDYAALVGLLERRLVVIADHDWRERDPDGQLEQLKSVSMDIENWRQRFGGAVDFHMQHYLQNCSYDKALAVARKRGRGAG